MRPAFGSYWPLRRCTRDVTGGTMSDREFENYLALLLAAVATGRQAAGADRR